MTALGKAKASITLAASYILSWGSFVVIVFILSGFTSKVRAVVVGYFLSYAVYALGIYTAGWIMKEEFAAKHPNIKKDSQDDLDFKLTCVNLTDFEENACGNDLTARPIVFVEPSKSGDIFIAPPEPKHSDPNLHLPLPRQSDSHIPPHSLPTEKEA